MKILTKLKLFIYELLYPVNSIIYKDLIKAEIDFSEKKVNCIAASRFVRDKMKGLPENWDYSFQFDSYGYGRLLFIHYSHYENKMEIAPLLTFKKVCNTIESLGIKLDKSFDEGYGFDANSKNTVTYRKGKFGIHIRQCQFDKCDIDYVDEIVKRPVLNGICAEVLKS